MSLGALRAGGKAALARALAGIEAEPQAEATLALLDAAWNAPRAQVIGLTGPPGVGKSTLLSALIAALRGRQRTVGVVAIDPSSRRTGGALLGDRTRIVTEPEDQGCFVRSLAARDRLGGLADLAPAAVVLMRAVFDVVLVETVGVGQSETEVADLADTVLFAVQPASGDSLQFMKAGIIEIPDVIVVTKADLGPHAERARRDLELALGIVPQAGWQPPVLTAAAPAGQGIDALLAALTAHAGHLGDQALQARRRAQAEGWVRGWLRDEFGRRGLERAVSLLDEIAIDPAASPFRRLALVTARLAP